MSEREPVNHYTAGGIEVIDIIKAKMPDGLTPYQGHLWACTIKYLMRFQLKGTPAADLRKGQTYLGWLIEEVGE
jgi:hypothetical protein